MTASARLLNRRMALTLGLGTCLNPPRVLAQGAGQPLRLIVPTSSGSGVDSIARSAAVALGRALGELVQVENLPGQGGVVGAQALIHAAPDGHTLALVANSHLIAPHMMKVHPYDPVADLTPLAMLGSTPLVLLMHPKLAASNLKEFTALLAASPGQLPFTSSGHGTILHLAAEIFIDLAQVQQPHRPAASFAPMLQDLISGQAAWGVAALPAALGAVRAGQVRALCVPSLGRSSSAPEIPSSGEAGQPFFVVEAWVAAVAPKGLPAEQVRRLHAALSSTFTSPEVREALSRQGHQIKVSSPEAAVMLFRDELKRYGRVVKRAGITPT